MDLDRRLALLGQGAAHEASGACGASEAHPPGRSSGCVYVAAGPGGRPFPLLKVLQTSFCERDCGYCAFRAGRDVARASVSPEEMAGRFESMFSAGAVRGLFLSSGQFSAGGGDPGRAAMDRMLATADLLRRRGYRGYLHLKVMPGADEGQVERAAALASRLSVNLEAPTAERLARIAARKSFRGELLAQVDRVARAVATRSGRASSWTTQFVVGPAGEPDVELLAAADRLYRQRGLGRAYYSPFEPVPGTPLDGEPATPDGRSRRLYQADWLLRFYGFSLRELPFDAAGALPGDRDPKSAWAALHPEFFPVDVNAADPADLLRVPGLGPRAARRIVEARRAATIRSADDLRRIGAWRARAAGFIAFPGRRAQDRSAPVRDHMPDATTTTNQVGRDAWWSG